MWECIEYKYTIHWDKTQVLKKSPLYKINRTKNAFIFLSRAPPYHSFTFNITILIWAEAEAALKMSVGFSIFDSASFLLKFIFLLNKMHFDFKTS